MSTYTHWSSPGDRNPLGLRIPLVFVPPKFHIVTLESPLKVSHPSRIFYVKRNVVTYGVLKRRRILYLFRVSLRTSQDFSLAFSGSLIECTNGTQERTNDKFSY